MAINIALAVTKVHDNKLILMPQNDAAQRLLQLSKSKFLLPKDLALARKFFGMDMHVVSGGKFLSDNTIPERYRHYILNNVNFTSVE